MLHVVLLKVTFLVRYFCLVHMQHAMLRDLTKVPTLKDESKLDLPSKPQQQSTWGYSPTAILPGSVELSSSDSRPQRTMPDIRGARLYGHHKQFPPLSPTIHIT